MGNVLGRVFDFTFGFIFKSKKILAMSSSDSDLVCQALVPGPNVTNSDILDSSSSTWQEFGQEYGQVSESDSDMELGVRPFHLFYESMVRMVVSRTGWPTPLPTRMRNYSEAIIYVRRYRYGFSGQRFHAVSFNILEDLLWQFTEMMREDFTREDPLPANLQQRTWVVDPTDWLDHWLEEKVREVKIFCVVEAGKL